MKRNKIIWKLCIIAVLLIVLFAYTPLVIGTGKIEPVLIGFPYSLWLSVLLTIFLVVLTFIGSIVIPDEEEDKQ